MLRILAIDDESESLRYLAQVLEPPHAVTAHTSSAQALDDLERRVFDLVIADLTMPQPDGFEVLRRVRQLERPIPVIVLSGLDRARAVIDALKLGASDFVAKPATPQEIRAAVERVGVSPGAPIDAPAAEYGLAGRSAAIALVRRAIPLLARVRETVLLVGETGTGKEIVARALHEHSPRRSGPFIAHNMAATPVELTESVFFGHVRGAFSGASADHMGLFEQADGGTLFLDEVDSFPLSLQAKLLRVLESNRVQRVGSRVDRVLDVRVIASSAVDLADQAARGEFRADVYYRLRQLELRLPALRDRTEDIPDLVRQFVGEISAELDGPPRISAAALDAMLAYSWPGNCRELRHAVRGAVLQAAPEPVLPCHLPQPVRSTSRAVAHATPDPKLDTVQRKHIVEVLERAGGNQSRAARLLGIDRGTLARRLGLHGPERPRG